MSRLLRLLEEWVFELLPYCNTGTVMTGMVEPISSVFIFTRASHVLRTEKQKSTRIPSTSNVFPCCVSSQLSN